MRKVIIFFLLTIIIIPISVNAKEFCKVVSGNGKDIGNEIACGSEHFYIIDSNSDEIRLMPKYNIMTNGRCDLYLFDNPEMIRTESDAQSEIRKILGLNEDFYVGIYPFDIINRKDLNDISQRYYGDLKTDGKGKLIGFKACTYGYYKSNTIYKQSEKAIGFKGKMNNLQFPYEGLFQDPSPYEGIVLNNSEGNIPRERDIYTIKNTYHQIYQDIEYNKILGEEKVLDAYKNYLTESGISVNEISNLTLSELEKLIFNISGKNIEIIEDISSFPSQVKEDEDDLTGIYSSHIVIYDLKKVIPEKYKWVYGTTYWLNTKIIDDPRNKIGGRLFVLTLGELCSTAPCSWPAVGLRPIINIPANELKFIIKTETNGKGTIEVINNAAGKEAVSFKSIPQPGYKLQSIIIKTDSGETVEFSEEEITKDKDGNLTVSKNKFTMPYDNVTIYARWGIVNPKTSSIAMKILLLIILIVYIGTFIYKKKRRVKI